MQDGDCLFLARIFNAYEASRPHFAQTLEQFSLSSASHIYIKAVNVNRVLPPVSLKGKRNAIKIEGECELF